MRQFPLLDLKSAWDDAQRTLQEIVDMVETLYHESEHTWRDMLTVRTQVLIAQTYLKDLPPAIVAGIAQDQADLDALEARADASSY